jgi:hypothetical protein
MRLESDQFLFVFFEVQLVVFAAVQRHWRLSIFITLFFRLPESQILSPCTGSSTENLVKRDTFRSIRANNEVLRRLS